MGLLRKKFFRYILGGVVLGIFFTAAFSLSHPDTGQAQVQSQKKSQRKVVLILINGTTLEDYSPGNTPNINALMEKGATALMNTRPAGARNTANAYATIGAGRHIVSSGFAGDAFNTDAKLDQTEGIAAGVSYIARTGKKPPAEGVVTLGISQIKIANEKEDILETPDLLGDYLHAAGLKTAVLGNGDIENDFNRDVVTIAMDKWGRVDFGDVSRNVLISTPESALGFQTDYQALLKKFKEIYNKADFIVVETGDTFRAEELSETTFPEIMSGEKRLAMARADAFVGQVLKSVNMDNTLIMVTSPHPSQAALKNSNYMAPLVFYKEGQKPGFLTSGTTRRPGITANTDIAPTVMSYLGAAIPSGLEGRVLETVPGENVINTLAKMNNDMVFVYKARPVLVKGYVGLQIIVMVSIIAIMTLWPQFLRYLRPGLLWLMAVPLSLLIVAAVRFFSLPLYTVIAILIAALIVVGAYSLWGKRDVDLFIIIGLATAGAVLLDVATGSTLIKNSTLGYDPMSGARYYGIGNEYMGVVIGAAIIAVASLWEKYYDKHPRRIEIFTVAVFVITTLIMGAPQLGSKVGGTIVGVAAFLFTYLQLKGVKVRFKQLAAIGGGVALILVMLAVLDMHRSIEVQSHLGRFANNILAGGWPVIWDMGRRKLGMNIRLIRYTIWSRFFLITLAALAVSFYRPVGLMEKVRNSYPYIFKGLLGILVGSAVALVFNDSGIVAAATMMIFGMAPMIYLMGRQREQEVEECGVDTGGRMA